MPEVDTKPTQELFHISVKAIITNSDNQILLLKRTRTHQEASYWELPGGRIDQDESTAQALQREVEEELGFEGELVVEKVIHADKFVNAKDRIKMPGVAIFCVFYRVRAQLEQIKLDPAEHIDYQWIDPSQLDDATWLKQTSLSPIFVKALKASL